MTEFQRRHFLPWDRPLLPQAVEWLAGDWNGGAPLDLSKILVVVPTRESDRRLREALADAAAARGQAVFPPRVVTPNLLLAPAAREETASELVSLLAWTVVLRRLDSERFRSVLPVDPPERSFRWALRLGRELSRVQSLLAESGLVMGDVVARCGTDLPEAARWGELAQLEQAHADALGARGLRAPQLARIAAAHDPGGLPGIERVVVIATPDPLPLAIARLERLARILPLDVLVFAPESEAANFDAWGRPLVAHWCGRRIDLPDFEQRVHACASPADQAERVARVASLYREPARLLAIGAVEEIAPLIEGALTRGGIPSFNPEGRPRRHDALHALVRALADFAAAPEFGTAAALLRCPDILAWIRRRRENGFSEARLLAELDDLQARHLPPTLEAARRHAAGFEHLAPALDCLRELHARVRGGFPAGAAEALAEIFAGRRIDADGDLAESAGAWMTVLREVAHACESFPDLPVPVAEAWELALTEFADAKRTAERPAHAIDVLGWLELLWEDAPHLVIAGCNEGRIPESINGHAFVPESLRVRLGLKTNDARLARDAYLLTAMIACRRASGRLDVLFGRTDAVGEPLRPSRLLLRCDDADLPARVQWLFRAAGPARVRPAWSRAWRLRPPPSPSPSKFPVTGLRDWLRCPFRFYLRHVLKMRAVDPAKAEIDPGDFGTLMHGALQQMGENPDARRIMDERALADFLVAEFERLAFARYGTELTLPLVLQFESARQRLRRAAVVEIRERADGWQTVRTEWPFELPVGGLVIRGKIDRIDRHADGRVRLLDYKTGDKARIPAEAHLRAARGDDAGRPDWVRWQGAADRERIWTDLQLPLYARAAAAEWGAAVSCGYFNLPKAVGETCVSPWEEYTAELQASAERCAEGVTAAVAAGTFWPPAELSGTDAEFDDFASLFHGGAAASIDPGAIAAPAGEAVAP